MKYLSCFKKIIVHCVKSGKLQRDLFLGFSMARREVEKQALTESQLQAIARENFGPPRLRLVRDIFYSAVLPVLLMQMYRIKTDRNS